MVCLMCNQALKVGEEYIDKEPGMIHFTCIEQRYPDNTMKRTHLVKQPYKTPPLRLRVVPIGPFS